MRSNGYKSRRISPRAFCPVGALLPVLFALAGCGGSSDEERAGPTPAPTPTAPADAATSPTTAGAMAALDGAKLVRERCTVCHDSERIDKATHDRAGWAKTVGRMMEKVANLEDEERKTSATINAAERTAILEHLASRPAVQ